MSNIGGGQGKALLLYHVLVKALSSQVITVAPKIL